MSNADHITYSLNSIKSIKEDIMQYLISQGIEMDSSTPFEYYPSKIRELQTTFEFTEEEWAAFKPSIINLEYTISK